MLEILTRLPTEPVLECKLVCKPWRDIIRLPSFSKLHLAHLNSSANDESGKFGFILPSLEQGLPHFYYTEHDDNFQQTPCSRETRMDLHPPFQYCYLVGSCNGLICFRPWMKDKIGKIHDGPYVCNPITREYIMLGDFERMFLSWTGFGHSSSTDEYKFVRIDKSIKDSNVRIVRVYTLGSGWRTVEKMDKNMEDVTDGTGAFANGALHWMDQAGTILAFNLTDEKFSEIPSPPPRLARAAVPYFSLVLKVVGGFLGAMCCYDVDCVDIWLLKKNTDNHNLSWSKDFNFYSDIYFPFGLTKSGRLLCYEDKKFYSFDSKASSAKLDASFGKSISQAIPHKNTLVSLKVLGEKHTKMMEFGERLRSSEETGNTVN